MKGKKTPLLKLLGSLFFALTILFALFAATAPAASYPSKPVRLIVPYPPGGTTDAVGRLIAAKLSERLGKQVVMDNRGGGGGIVGTEIAAKAAPDGYTLYVASGSYAIQPALQKLPYDPLKAFTPIARVVSGPTVLVVNASLPAHSVKELVALAKQKPGQLVFVSSGIGGNPHMAMELFRILANIDIKIVHFKGGGPAIIDLLGGHSHGMMGSLIERLPHIKSGKFRVLGTSGTKRSAFLPDVPTIAEAGVPGYEVNQWFGLLAPAGTPAPIVDKLNKEIKVILAQNEVKKRFMDAATEVDYLGPAEFGRFIEKDINQWSQVVKKANIKIDE